MHAFENDIKPVGNFMLNLLALIYFHFSTSRHSVLVKKNLIHISQMELLFGDLQ